MGNPTNHTAGDTWQGDAVGLVDAFRSGERSPVEELEATHAAIDASDLNAVCFTDRDTAMASARNADVSLPFGGVPVGIKELTRVEGWPDTEASVPLKDRVAAHTSTMVQRIVERGGAVLAGQTTASEFGGVNLTRTVLHGATHNPWQHGKTPAALPEVLQPPLPAASFPSPPVVTAVGRFAFLRGSPDSSA